MSQTRRSNQDVEGAFERLTDRHIKDLIYLHWFHRTASPTVRSKLYEEAGVTDAITLRADVHIEVFVKFHPDDAPKEERGYNLLRESSEAFAQHLVPPFPMQNTMNGTPFWLAPLVNAKTLHQLVYEQNDTRSLEPWIGNLYANFLESMQNLWLNTKSLSSPNFRDIYVNRIQNRMSTLEEGLKKERGLKARNFSSVKTIVNGKEYDNFGNLMKTFSDHIDSIRLPFSCTTHSDEHAKNIMVYEDAERRDETGWVIIDYVGARKHSDWILSIAKMLQWWDYYCVLEQAKSNRNLRKSLGASYIWKRGGLEISYNEDVLKSLVPDCCRVLSQIVIRFAQQAGKILGENEQAWRQRLELALFSIIFASVPLHIPKADFAVPIMIGESLKHFSQTGLM